MSSLSNLTWRERRAAGRKALGNVPSSKDEMSEILNKWGYSLDPLFSLRFTTKRNKRKYAKRLHDVWGVTDFYHRRAKLNK